MLNGNHPNGNELSGDHDCQPDHGRLAAGSRYAHILVPTNLALTDRPALMLGMELAAIHRAALTVLYVLPSVANENSMQGLAAIGLLHQAVKQLQGGARSHDGLESPEMARPRIDKFLKRVVPEHLLNGVEVRTVCRAGDLAEKITQFADEAAVDLVILPNELSHGWLPILPARVRRVLQLARQQVILAPSEARSQKPIISESA